MTLYRCVWGDRLTQFGAWHAWPELLRLIRANREGGRLPDYVEARPPDHKMTLRVGQCVVHYTAPEAPGTVTSLSAGMAYVDWYDGLAYVDWDDGSAFVYAPAVLRDFHAG